MVISTTIYNRKAISTSRRSVGRSIAITRLYSGEIGYIVPYFEDTIIDILYRDSSLPSLLN
jgi:hypothetical protein